MSRCEKEETACHDAAPSQRLLGCLLALLLNVLDTSARAIVIVVELVECPEITTEAQSETSCICDQILEASRLSSFAFLIWGRSDRLFSAAILTWWMQEARCVVGLLVGIPAQYRGRHPNPLSVARHTKLIQGSDVASTLWKTIRGHEALVTALQGDLRVTRQHWPVLCMCSAVFPDVVAREFLRCGLQELSVGAVQL